MTSIYMRAYKQEHYTDKQEFLDAVSEIIGEGTLLELHSKMIDKYGLPELGTGRVAYISKKCVFKVPISADGFRNNDFEYSLVSTNIEGMTLAKTKMAIIDDIEVLAMEKVTKAEKEDIRQLLGHVPEWTDAIDMCQVGFNSKGVLMAYDYPELMCAYF